MRASFLFFIAVVLNALHGITAQTTVNGSFVHDGITRTYSFYVPASYSAGNPVPLIIGLHGTGSGGAQFAQYRDFRPIADTANFIMVHPDGTTMLGQKFWNFGNVLGSTVDDAGFLVALIDTISAHYSVNQSRVYCVGMSNGGFMTYYMACQTNRFAAIGSVTGSMSTSMYNNCNPQRPTPSIHVHGTNDPTNAYNGSSGSKSIPDVNRFWVNQNGCDTVPAVFPVPDIITTDNATAVRYLYSNGINGNTVELFKVTGGEHTWPGCPMPGSSDVICMDFDARKEIWRFFSQYQLTVTSVHELANSNLSIWPNPVQTKLNIKSELYPVTSVVVMDIHGREIKNQNAEDLVAIDMKGLKAGMYLVKLSGSNFNVMRKVIVEESN